MSHPARRGAGLRSQSMVVEFDDVAQGRIDSFAISTAAMDDLEDGVV